MPSTTIKRLALTLPMSALLSLAPRPASARPIRVTLVDQDAVKSDVVAVARLGKAQFLYSSKSWGQQVDHYLSRLHIEVAIKGPSQGISIVHDRVNPGSQPVSNGYGPPPLHAGKIYLLFLKRSSKGRYRLVSSEDPYLVTIPTQLLPLIKRQVLGKPLPATLKLLETVLHSCRKRCMAPIWLLDGSRRFHALLKASATRRKRFVQSLLRLAVTGIDSNTTNAAFTSLGRLRVHKVIPRILAAACPGGRVPKGQRVYGSEAINWLQGFPPGDQIPPLKRIARCSKQPDTRKYARSRLADARRQLQWQRRHKARP